MVKPKANQQETIVKVHIENGLPEISGDRKQLGEALVNLMVNALEAMTHRGKLTVSACLGQSGTTDGATDGPNERMLIKVSDTGLGLDENSLDKVFDPFFTTKASGTGLGLSIVQTIVRGHGGEITLESAEGKGAEFRMSLPIAAEQGS